MVQSPSLFINPLVSTQITSLPSWKNLLIMDKEYFSFGRVNSQGVIANVGEPRTFGVTASIRF